MNTIAVAPNGKGRAATLPDSLRPAPFWKRPVFLITALVLITAGAAAAVLFSRSHPSVSYTTVPVARQDLAQAVTASGTVNPQNTILVGTQVSGTIQTIYVDYNSRVRQNEVLARLDPSQFQAQLDQAQGTLAQLRAQAGVAAQAVTGAGYSVNAADATVSAARSDVAKARSALLLAQMTVARDRALLARGYLAQSQYDADYTNAVADRQALASAQAELVQNSSQSLVAGSGALGSAGSANAASEAVQSAAAVVAQDRLNLERTVITSPVDGTVVARNVSVGQTVAASFQTPTLFTIAQDLTKMEVDIAVGEPDIGNVRPGDRVDFSVLAYPNRVFHGIVSQVRVNPTTVANVVTYTVVVLVDNTKNALLPGMTANAGIRVAQVKNALVVPVQALAYRPSGGRPRTASSNGASSNLPQSGASSGSPWGLTASGSGGAVVAGGTGVIFVLTDGKPHAVRVRIDLVNGMQAAVTPLRGSLVAGDAAIVADSGVRAPRSGATSAPGPGLGRMIR